MTLAALALPPRLWVTDPNGERRVTWMELFFDLIFVAAVAQVGAPLAKDYGWTGLLRYGFLFVLIWWAWSGHTLYSTRFDHDDLVHRMLILKDGLHWQAQEPARQRTLDREYLSRVFGEVEVVGLSADAREIH